MSGRQRRRTRYEPARSAVAGWAELATHREAEAQAAAEAAARAVDAARRAEEAARAEEKARKKREMEAAVARAAGLATAAAGLPAEGARTPAAAGRDLAHEPHPIDVDVAVAGDAAPPAEVEVVATPARPRRHRLLATAVMAGIAGAAFLTGLFVFNNWLMPQLIHGAGQVRVPDLANLTLEQAEIALRPLGLQLSRAGERFDPAVPRGFVLAQDPEPGTEVRGRKRVSVVMSLGEEYSSVPELFGESPRGARLLIERSGLRVGGVTHAPSEDVGPGLVVGTDPGPETVLMRDTPVHLLVSTGPGEESYVMPDLVGHDGGSARRQLEALGFHVALEAGSHPNGVIVGQSPAPGSRVTPLTAVALQTAGRGAR